MPALRWNCALSTLVRQLAALFVTWTLLLPPVQAELALSSPRGELRERAAVQDAAQKSGSQQSAVSGSQDSTPEPQGSGDSSSLGRGDRGPIPCKLKPDVEELNPILNEIKGAASTKDADDWGNISVAQPKIWQFERVNALLDGLLRDVEGVSLNDLTQLDPNAQNAAAVKFVQTALEIGVQYDQAAAVTNGINRNNYRIQSEAAQKRFEADNAYIELLVQQRNVETAQLLAAQNTVNTLKPLADAKTITPQQQEQLDIANSRVASLTSSLANINDAIGKASLSSLTAAPNLNNTSVQQPLTGADTKATLSAFSDMLKNLPPGAQTNLNNALQAPSLPATKRLDNFITLLYERLAREVSVLQDDLTRSPENVAYLMQFDVGVYPSKKARNHNARVEFQINCPNCKVYSIYPGQSSYNLANYLGSSKRTTIWGNLLTLIGLGASASYRHQVDAVQGSLVQSVYTAGFQDGLAPDSKDATEMPDGSKAVQRFGWYYGTAPFENTVSPGIRTTFAIVTVPRSDIDKARDIFGNSDACMPVHILSSWARRDDPMKQRESYSLAGEAGRILVFPFYEWQTHELIRSESHGGTPAGDHYASSVERKSTSVKLPGAPEESSLIAKREHDRLHVLRMEYNTVFTDSPPPPTPVLMVATAPASSGTGAAATSVSIAAPAATPAPAPTPSAPYDPLSPCPKDQCAGMLIRLDRPIDPNLTITVRGEPLKRVRDWRGRVTSVLPAAQSGSDLTGTNLTKQLQTARSLLETDQAAPNTWFALNSNEIFLSISKDLATDDEFPVIQVSDANHSIIIPHELRKGTTDLIINGLHMQTQTIQRLRAEFLRTYASDEAIKLVQDSRAKQQSEAPVTAGPYPYTTFVPLFLQDAKKQKFYVRLGETGNEIMIGMSGKGCKYSGYARHPCWSEGHTQVILEDRDLDFAWSLSCYVQGEELACGVPVGAIDEVYSEYAKACRKEAYCPGAKDSATVLQRSLDEYEKNQSEKLQLQMKKARDESTPPQANPDQQKTAEQRVAELNKQILEIPGQVLRETNLFNGEKLSYAYVPTLQVWVTQSDVDDEQVFYSAEPAHLDFFPLSSAYREKGPVKTWHFVRATPEAVTIAGCNYFPDDTTAAKHSVTLLGSLFSSSRRQLSAIDGDGCAAFDLETIGLTRGQLVFKVDADKGSDSHYPTPMSIPIFKLAPSFSQADAEPEYGKINKTDLTQLKAKSWTLDFLVKRALHSDTLDFPDGLLGITFDWFLGNNPVPDDFADQQWEDADKAERIHLQITVPRSLLMQLPDEVHLIRHSDKYGDVPVATLPNLRKLILPGKLKLEPLSATQFVLRGENAGEISAVAIQGGATPRIVQTSTGTDFAFVSLPAAPTDAGGGNTGNSTPQGGESTKTISVTKNNDSTNVKITDWAKTPAPTKPSAPNNGAGNNKGNQQPQNTADQTKPKKDAPAPLDPGTYGVIPLFEIDERDDPTYKPPAPQKGVTPPPVPKISDYAPIFVEDMHGKLLMFVVPEPKKTPPKTDTPATQPACAAPCLLLQGCAAPCPATTPATKPASTPGTTP